MGPDRSPRRQVLLVLLSVLLSLGASLSVAEWVLRAQRDRIEQSDHLDHGLFNYDAVLGWRLAPDWQGRHRHFDYQVRYVTNTSGFRGTDPAGNQPRQTLVLGDSFTFGFGVADEETFVTRLNRHFQAAGQRFINLGVPGYSTDQQLLLLRELAAKYGAEHVWLVVYLGNDLVDNTLARPLQAPYAKPFFVLGDAGLQGRNIPVPLRRNPVPPVEDLLTSLTVPETLREQDTVYKWLTSLELARRLGVRPRIAQVKDVFYTEQLGGSVGLFTALVEAIREQAQQMGAELKVFLLPGRSSLYSPGGYSAQFQDYLRRMITSHLDAAGVAFLDLSIGLGAFHGQPDPGLYFPNDGHLTARGHQRVAALMGGDVDFR